VIPDPQAQAAGLLESAEGLLGELDDGEHEVCATHEVVLRAVYEHDDFTVSASDSSSEFGVRSIVDGRLGFATTNSTRPEALRRAAREARDVGRVATPSEHHHVADGVGTLAYEEVCHRALLGVEPGTVYGWLAALVEEARRDDRVTLDRAEVSWTVVADVLANSRGVRASSARASSGWVVMGMARSGEEITSFDYEGAEAASPAGIEQGLLRSATLFRTSVLGSLGARRGRSYRGAVLLHPNVVLELLGDFVTANCNGRQHVDDVSPWKGRLGERVASEVLTVFEDPRNRDLGDWTPFDREGRPTAYHELLARGRLAFLAYDGFNAHRAGVEPTGNADGGADSLPTTGFGNLAVVGDPAVGRVLTEDALARELGRGLVVKRFSGNVDVTSGHFSGTAKNSWWVEDGARAHAVHEMMIAGNVLQVLENVIAVGDTLHDVDGASRAPYVLVDGLSVTGD